MLNADIQSIENLRRFSHVSMATTFEVFLVHPDALYAEQAAFAAFEELDRIENNLSRFIPNSDVSRINSFGKAGSLPIGLSAFECLQISLQMHKRTKGAFDITFGSLHKGGNLLKLSEASHTIKLKTEGVKIDLGAIGKGYAADKMAELLVQWSIDTALISAGGSTIVPIGTPAGMKGWPIAIFEPSDSKGITAKIQLAGFALSASGIQKGPHIIDPRKDMPAEGKIAAWAAAKTGACADALSTAFMVMPLKDIRAFCTAHKDTSAFVIQPGKKNDAGGRVLSFGGWDKFIL